MTNIPFSQQTILHNFRKIKYGITGQAALAVCFNKRSAMLLVFASPSSIEHINIYNQHSCTRVLVHMLEHSSKWGRRTGVYLRWSCCWTRQIGGIWKLRPAYSPETPNLGKNRWCFVPCDLEIWWMTLENNRASLLCCFKLCATFHSHWWIQTGVTVRKCLIWVKFDDF